MEQIGRKIQTLRRNKNMTQGQLAEVLSVSAQSVSKWENGLSVPDISLLPIIARYFGITMDELFGYRLDALNYRERFIRFMADNGVLQFGQFRLQSGRVSPYMINTANYKSGSQITKLGEFYAACIREHNVEGNLLMGNTEKEIPIMIAANMVLYSRYGMDISYCIDNSVGKRLGEGDRVILMKDTLTSGSSLRENLEQCGAGRVSDIIVSVDRMERGSNTALSARHALERQYGVKIHAIVDLDDIIRALETGVIGGREYLDAIRQYREIYGGE